MGRAWAMMSGDNSPGLFEEKSTPQSTQHRVDTTTNQPREWNPLGNLWKTMTGQHTPDTVSHSLPAEDTAETVWAKSVRVHEAAHARVANSKGGQVEVIEVAGGWGGGVTGFHSKRMSKYDLLLSCVVGQAAQVRYLVREEGMTKREAIAWTTPGSASDRAAFESEAEGTGYTWESMWPEATAFARRHEWTIERTAQRLVSRSRESGTWA